MGKKVPDGQLGFEDYLAGRIYPGREVGFSEYFTTQAESMRAARSEVPDADKFKIDLALDVPGQDVEAETVPGMTNSTSKRALTIVRGGEKVLQMLQGSASFDVDLGMSPDEVAKINNGGTMPPKVETPEKIYAPGSLGESINNLLKHAKNRAMKNGYQADLAELWISDVTKTPGPELSYTVWVTLRYPKPKTPGSSLIDWDVNREAFSVSHWQLSELREWPKSGSLRQKQLSSSRRKENAYLRDIA